MNRLPLLWLLAPAGLLYGGLAVMPLVTIVRFSLENGLSHYADVLGSRLLGARSRTRWRSA